MLKILILTWFINLNFADDLADDFYDSLKKEGSVKANFSTTFSEIILDTNEEKIFYERVTTSIDNSAIKAIGVAAKKLDILDEGLNLSQSMQASFREEQKRLAALQREYASRIVEAKISRSTNITSNSLDNYLDFIPANQKLIEDKLAVNTYKSLETKQKETFSNGWKAALIDKQAEKSFALALSALNLQGIALAQNIFFSTQLENYASEYVKRRQSQPKVALNEQEKVEFIVAGLKQHYNLFSLPIKRSLERISELENKVRLALGRNELDFNLKKLEWEKSLFVKNLAREGLELMQLDLLNPNELELAVLQFYQAKLKKGKALKWPLNEVGVTIQKFHQDRPFIELGAFNENALLAPCAGEISLSESELSISCHKLIITFNGNYLSVVKHKDSVEAGDLLANLDKPYRVFISAILDNSEVDFLSFF